MCNDFTAFLSQTCFAPPEAVTNRQAVSLGTQVQTIFEESLTLGRRMPLSNIIIIIYVLDPCLDIPAVIQISKSH